MQLRRIGEFELDHALSPTLFAARRGAEHVLLRLTEAPQGMDAVLLVWLSEARLAKTIEHPGLGKLLDLGLADGYVYFAYEAIPQARVLGIDVSLSEAFTIAHKLCAALAHLHEANAVHRGVSPRAIVLGSEGEVRLLDFMSLELRAQDVATRRERIPYLSPEQSRGAAVDARSDQYSLASVLWELTVGQRRFPDEQAEHAILESIRVGAERPSKRWHTYPRWLEPVIMRALATDPEKRYPDMVAFAEALANCSN